MASESSPLIVYNSRVQNIAGTLSNREIDIDDRFDLVAQTLLAGAQVVMYEHVQRVNLQDKVNEIEKEKSDLNEKLNETEGEIERLKEIRKQTLDKEIAKKIRVLSLREKVNSVSEKGGFFIGLVAIAAIPLGAVAFPPSLAVSIPVLIGGVSAGAASMKYKEKAFKEKWILEHYPEALDDKKVRNIAEEDYLEVGSKEFDEKYKIEIDDTLGPEAPDPCYDYSLD